MADKAIPILMYHSIGERRSPITLPKEVFRWQLGWLHKQGYHTLNLRELAEIIRSQSALPDLPVLLTFDDGYVDFYHTVFPLLESHGFTATVFLVSGYCGKDNDWPGQPAAIPRLELLNWTQVTEMDRYGIEFGAHTRTHPRLDQLSVEQCRQEVHGSKADIEDRLGHAVHTFAYPYGRMNEKAQEFIQEAFTAACSSRIGLAHTDSDLFALERIEVLYLKARTIFQGMSSGWMESYLSLRSGLHSLRRRVSGEIY